MAVDGRLRWPPRQLMAPAGMRSQATVGKLILWGQPKPPRRRELDYSDPRSISSHARQLPTSPVYQRLPVHC
jgi:hypothetical protein